MMLDHDQPAMQNGGETHITEVAATQSSSVSNGAISKDLMNGVASGAAMISSGIHAVADVAGIAKSGNTPEEDDSSATKAAEEGGKSNSVPTNDSKEAQSNDKGKPSAGGFTLQFGTVDDTLVSAIVTSSADESAGAKEPSSASTPDALSPMPSQAIDAKPLVIDDTAERPLGEMQAAKPSFGSLNVFAREFTPSFCAPNTDAAAIAATPSSEVMWSDVGITDESEASLKAWSQWDYHQQVIWSEDHQEYGTYAQSLDGDWLWYPAQYAEGWNDNGSYQYWNNGYSNGGYYMNGNGRAARWNGQGNVSYGRQENMPPAGSAAAHGANGAVPLDAAAGNGTAKKKEKRRGAKGQQQGLKETYGSEAVQAACLAVLEQQYPAYSQSSLREMLSMNNGSLSHALDMLANLEAETQKQRKPKAEKTPALVLDEENFPSLSAASTPAPSPVKPKQQPAIKHIKRPGSPDSPLPNGATTPATPRSVSPGPGSIRSSADPAAPTAESSAPSEAATFVTEELPSAEHEAAEQSPKLAAYNIADMHPADATAASATVQIDAAVGAHEHETEADPDSQEANPEADESSKAADAPDQVEDRDAASSANVLASDYEHAEAAGGQKENGDATKPRASEGREQAWVPAPAPQIPAWSRKNKPAFLLAARDDSAQISTPPTVLAPRHPLPPPQKRAVPISQGSAPTRKAPGAAKSGKADAPWVATGAAVDAQYTEARSEARDHMRLRNTFFQQATQAYLGGDKALAKELGAKGRWHARQMLEAHASASASIYRQRNKASGGKGGPAVIDLHGQHVAEAIKLLRRELPRLRRAAGGQNRQSADQAQAGAGRSQRIQILVGNNHHSKAKHSVQRLPAAVEDFLNNEGISFKKPVDGAIEILA